jgi:iron complex outermembrane receptor protein
MAGGEAMLTYIPASWWKMSGSYSLFSIDPDYTAPAIAADFDGLNTPRHLGFVRSSLSLPRAVELDATLFATGNIRALRQPGYTRVDGRIAWRPRAPVELSLAIQNVFDSHQVEFGSPSSVVAEPSRMPRTAYGGVTWRF